LQALKLQINVQLIERALDGGGELAKKRTQKKLESGKGSCGPDSVASTIHNP
jgi:c-di-AMP phosphodiesterase-like protein